MLDHVEQLKGMSNVIQALRLEDFPMTRTDIDYSVGDMEIIISQGFSVPVRDLTDRFERDEFDSVEEIVEAFQQALDNVIQGRRESQAA